MSGLSGEEVEAPLQTSDWANTLLSSPEHWSADLSATVRLILSAPAPLLLLWGDRQLQVSNAAYKRLFDSTEYAGTVGQPLANDPALAQCHHAAVERVWTTGNNVQPSHTPCQIKRHEPQQRHFTTTYSAVTTESGAVAGVLCWITEVMAPIECQTVDITAARPPASRPRDFNTQTIAVHSSQETYLYAALQCLPINVFSQDRELRYTWEHNLSQSLNQSIVGKQDEQLFTAADAARLTEIKRCVLSTGTRTQQEIKLTIDGRSVYYDLTIEPLIDTTQTVVGITGAAIDITDRKQAEINLRESEARFRVMADSAPVMIWMSGLDKLCDYFNRGWLDFTGRSWEQELGNGWADGVHPDDYANCLDVYTTAFDARQPFSMEYRLRRFDGEYRWLLDRGSPRFSPDGSFLGFIGSCIDITDRKLTEKVLQQQEEELRLITNAVPVLIGYVDAEQHYRFNNQTFEAWFGEPVEKFYGKHIREVLGDRAYDLVLPYVTRVLAGKRVAFESQLIYQNAGTRYVKATYIPHLGEGGLVEGYVSLVTDITEQKQAEASLRQSEERLRVALKNSPISMFHQDRELHYTWIYNNPSQGSKPEDVLGKRDVDLLPAMEAAIISQLKQRVIETGIGERQEIQLPLAGQACYFDLTVEPLKNAEAEIVGVTCAAIDISERKRAELALHHSKTLLNALLACAPIGIAFFDRDLRHVHANEALATLNGLPLSDHIGNRLPEVLPETASSLVPLLHQVMQSQQPLLNQAISGENRLGEFRYCLVNYYPVCLPDGQLLGIGVTATDVTAFKQTQIDLQQSEERFRQLAENIQDVFWIFDPDTRQMLYVSPAYEHLWGRPCDRLYADYQEWGNSIHPDDRDRIEAACTSKIMQGEYDEEFRIVRPDGSIRWIRDRGFPVKTATGDAQRVTGIAADITDRKLAEEALRGQETILRSMVEANPMGMVLADIDGAVREANDAFLAIVGCSRETLQSGILNLVDLTPPEYIPLDAARLARAKATGISGSYEKVYIRSDGNRIPVLIGYTLFDAARQQAATFILDLTERKRSEEALRQSEARLQLALQGGGLGTWDWHLQTNTILWSEGHYTLLGFRPGECQPSYEVWLNQVHPDDRTETEAVLRDAIASQTDYRHEYRVVWSNGAIHWLEARGQFYLTPQGQPHRMLGILVDITDRKQAEQEREQLLKRERLARTQAEAANRVKDEFLAVLSHELRSPLNPILGWTQLLRKRRFDPVAADHALEIIERNVKLQTQLIEDLLDVSRILRGKLALTITPVDLLSTIEAALETVRLAAEAKGVGLQTTLNSLDGQVVGDANRLQQVVWNLLSNAVKFTPSGGHVDVRLNSIGGHAQIQVIDTGKGINPEFLPHVFEYFRQEDGKTTRQFGGLGLGLAIVRHLTELHGGTVRAESLGENQGATFTVELPLQTQHPIALTPAALSTPLVDSSTLAGITVLVVDDEQDMRELVTAVLQGCGAAVQIASSATEALALLATTQPDILLSDIGMPEVDGYMMMRQIREQLAAKTLPPAIALTAYAGELNKQKAIVAGFQQHLSKPVEPETLIRAIATILKLT